MTIPQLIQNTEEKIYISQLRKSYSSLENAFRMAVSDNGTPDNWDLTSDNMITILEPYLKIVKNCGSENFCIPQDYKTIGGIAYTEFNASNRSKAVLADGTLLITFARDKNCNLSYGEIPSLKNTCGWYHIDVNGFKKPNQWGKDLFAFHLSKNSIVPIGTKGDMYPFSDGNGFGKAAWVLQIGNMDYLHCSGLSWDGKKTCR